MILTVATSNVPKYHETVGLIGDLCDVRDLGIFKHNILPLPDETGNRLHENAAITARHVFDMCRVPVCADSSGLFVTALGGFPGVHPPSGDRDNIDLLRLMQGVSNRSAVHRTVICYINKHGNEFYFDGIRKGWITHRMIPTKTGYGFDGIFCVEGSPYSMMSAAEKNLFSARGMAFRKLKKYIREQESLEQLYQYH